MQPSNALVRALVLAAFTTLLAWLISVVSGKDAAPAPTGLRLEAATSPRELPAPAFGPVVTGVHSAEDAVQTRSGWAVLDSRSEQIVFLDSGGVFLSRTGRRGEGPGELIRALHIALLDTLVVVAEGAGTRLDAFSDRGTFIWRMPLSMSGCASAGLRGLASGTAHVVTLRLCTRAGGRTSVLLERVSPAGEQVLLTERPLRDVRDPRFDPTRMPMIATVDHRVYLGITPDPCILEITSGGEAVPALCHPDSHPVPLPDSLRAELRRLAPRFDAVGASLVIPDRYPPFEGILSLGGRLAFHTILDADARALDVVRDGHLDRILLPRGLRVFVGVSGLLLARDELEGTAFAVLRLP